MSEVHFGKLSVKCLLDIFGGCCACGWTVEHLSMDSREFQAGDTYFRLNNLRI
jgi:hypothetical protein